MRAEPSLTRGSTRFAFGQRLSSPADVSIYDVTGRLVRTLAAPSGTDGIEWDGRDRAGMQAASGSYIARIRIGERAATARVVIAR